MIRVLVVDDDFMVARIHVGYVGRVPGFSVVGTAHGGRAAITSVEELRPDLVLLDVYMADMSGLDVLHHLRGLAHPVDILMITAANDMATVRAALRAGVVNYLVKPFTAAELTDRLDQYAQTRRRLAVARPGGPGRHRPPPGRHDPHGPPERPVHHHLRPGRRRPPHQRRRPVGSGNGRGDGSVPGERAAVPGVPVRHGPGRTPPEIRNGGPPGTPLPLDVLSRSIVDC